MRVALRFDYINSSSGSWMDNNMFTNEQACPLKYAATCELKAEAAGNRGRERVKERGRGAICFASFE